MPFPFTPDVIPFIQSLSGMGWLGGNDAASDDDTVTAQKKAAAAKLAARMRQQSPNVPPAETPAGDTFKSRFGSLSPGGDLEQNAAPLTNVPLPQPRPDMTSASPQAPPQAVPPNLYNSAAPPAAANGANVAQPPAPQSPSMFDKLNTWRGDNSPLLLALGAGLAGAPSIGAGLGQAFRNAGPVVQQNQTVQALVKRGMPADMAQLAASNPAALQQILPQLLGVKQQTFTQVGEDMFGNKKYGFVDPVKGTVTPFQGSTPFGTGQAGTALGVGENQVNPQLTGEAYLKQFPAEVQAAVKDYVEGRSMPTGNPRAGFTQAVKMVAQKYGNDIGTPADDNTYAARHKAVTGLASTTPGSLGGQMTYARTSLNHLGDVADAAVDLKNSNGLGLAPLAHLINNTRGLSTEQSGKIAGLSDAAGHYGQEVTKYYAGSPGGEGERQQFQSSLGGAKAPIELADVLQQELNLATGKISKTQATIDESLGPNSKYQVSGPAEQKDIARVQAAISRLRGDAPAASQAQTATTPQVPAPEARRVGQVYQTPKGPARWLGSGWQLVQ